MHSLDVQGDGELTLEDRGEVEGPEGAVEVVQRRHFTGTDHTTVEVRTAE
jgi:hypothetical protein